MCGINGFTIGGNSVHQKIDAMNEATKHRGPDGVGVWGDEHITLGQNLLAITETPRKAKQPCVSKDGNFVLIYNGEVYNYKKLRKELGDEGVVFETDGDTEVIFSGLIRHGSSYFEKLDGMFAIAAWHKPTKTLYLAKNSTITSRIV